MKTPTRIIEGRPFAVDSADVENPIERSIHNGQYQVHRARRAEYRYVEGQLQRRRKPQQLRGLNRDHYHDMKDLFKSTATWASSHPGPFADFYAALLSKGMKPEMARLTLARKIAAITLRVWKRGERFDVKHLKLQTA